MNKIYLFLFILLLGVTSSFAQTDINSFNAVGGGFSTTYLTDYQCLGINPANLGWKNDEHHFSLGLLETGISLYTKCPYQVPGNARPV